MSYRPPGPQVGTPIHWPRITIAHDLLLIKRRQQGHDLIEVLALVHSLQNVQLLQAFVAHVPHFSLNAQARAMAIRHHAREAAHIIQSVGGLGLRYIDELLPFHVVVVAAAPLEGAVDEQAGG